MSIYIFIFLNLKALCVHFITSLQMGSSFVRFTC